MKAQNDIDDDDSIGLFPSLIIVTIYLFVLAMIAHVVGAVVWSAISLLIQLSGWK